MNKSERIQETTRRNQVIKEFFVGYMSEKGYKFVGKTLSKGYVVMVLLHGGRRVRIFDNNPNHKFEYIALCLTPTNNEEADYFYRMLEIEKKELGTKAWKENHKSQDNE